MTSRIEGRYAVEWPADGDSCRVLAIGDSSLTAEGLADARQLWLQRALDSIHLATGRSLHLVVRATPRARLRQAEGMARYVAEEDPDVVVVAVGTNDVLPSVRLVADLLDYTNRYRQMVRRLHRPGRLFVVTGVGNLWHTPALTRNLAYQLLRPAAAALSWYVDRSIRRAVSGLAGVELIDTRTVDGTMWAGRNWLYNRDAFHPSAAGHDVWAALARPALARAIAAVPEDRPAVAARDAGAPDPDNTEVTYVRTHHGVARVRDTGGPGRAVIVMPDSPNVLEHLEPSFRGLSPDFRVVGLEMPGAGYTDLRAQDGHHPGFDFSLRSGAEWILDVMRALEIDEAIVTASCVNGLYAAVAAELDPKRVRALVLCQTPSLPQLKAWAKRTIPWPLRHRLLGDRLLRVSRRWFAARWYEQALGPDAPPDTRARFEDIARQGFRAGASWRLAPLVTAILREPDDAPRRLDVPTTVLWGDGDETHRRAGTDPESLAVSRCETRRIATGHFPDLEDPDAFARAVSDAAAHVWPVVAGDGASHA